MAKDGTGRNIGYADAPSRTCDDKHCPFHGNLSVRGRILTGEVISAKNTMTVTIRRELLDRDPKYKRVYKKYGKISAHAPPCIDAVEGDTVRIGECRPIAKTISFVVIENLTNRSE